jgi:hypothetical protein
MLYRLYLLRDGHIWDRIEVRAETDAGAQRAAENEIAQCSEEWDAFELWEGERRVISASKAG